MSASVEMKINDYLRNKSKFELFSFCFSSYLILFFIIIFQNGRKNLRERL